MTKSVFLCSSSFLVCAWYSVADAQSGPQVTKVDLGQSGLAQYSLSETVEGKNTIRLLVPAEHSSDVLASLVVSDPAGGVVGLHTDTPSSSAEKLRGSAFEKHLPQSAAELLFVLKGTKVRVTTKREDVEGVVIGVSNAIEVINDTSVEYPVALLISGGLVSEVVLLPETSVVIDEADALLLAQAAKKNTTKQELRTFDVELEVREPRTVQMSYVTEAPAWKNSWRLLLDEGRLQGWATFENTSAQAWADVDVTLSTGNPVAYRRDLINPLRFARQEPPKLAAEPPKIRADSGFAKRAHLMPAPQAQAMMMGQSNARGLEEMEADFSISYAAEEAQAIKGIGNVRYVIPKPVNLEAGRTANLLYLDMPVEAKVEALYQPGQSSDILLAVRLSADEPLAPGLVSVRDANGFVGDTPFTGLAAGQSRMLPYAVAPGAIVTKNETKAGELVDLIAGNGGFSIEVRSQIRTEYQATLPDQVKTFVVEHPKTGAEIVQSSGSTEENEKFIRISQEVKDGRVSIEILEETVKLHKMSADRNGYRNVVSFLTIGATKINEEDRVVVQKATDIINAISRRERELDDIKDAYQNLIKEQKRFRENLRAVQSNKLRKSYEDKLYAVEDQIAELLSKVDVAEETIRKDEQRLENIFKELR